MRSVSGCSMVLNSRGKTAPTDGFWMVIQTAISAEKTSCAFVFHLEGRRWRLVSRYTMMPDRSGDISGNIRPGTVFFPRKSLWIYLPVHLEGRGLRPVSGYTTVPNSSGKMAPTGSSATSLAPK